MKFLSFHKRQIVIPCGLLFVSLLLSMVALHPTYAHASASVQNITISPATQTVDLKAGTSTSGTITIINGGTASTNVTLYSRPYSVTDEQYDSQFEKPTANSDIYQWVSFSNANYALAAGETKVVPYTINVPAHASPGGHYGVIFVETEPTSTSGSNAVLRKQRVGSLLYAHVAGTAIRTGGVLTEDAGFWQTTPPLTVSSRVQNTGNIDFQAHVTLTVKDVFGSTKYNASRDVIVLPGTTRNIVTSWAQTPWYGLYSAQQSVTVLGKTTSSTRLILIAPQWLLLTLIIIVVILAGYGLLKYRKTR